MEDMVFMVMPFNDESANAAYNFITKPIIESLGFKIVRADEIFSTNPIFNDITTAIEQAILVIVDITGRNPNCFYELGVAHTLKQSRTIVITRDDYKEIPFDVAHFRIIKYTDSIKGREEFERQFRKTIESILHGIELYQKEFSLIAETLYISENQTSLFLLLALAKTSQEISFGEGMVIEGSKDGMENNEFTQSGSNTKEVNILESLEYIIEIDNILRLTEKGKGFAEFLSERRYECHFFNGEIFTDGFEPYLERLRRKDDHNMLDHLSSLKAGSEMKIKTGKIHKDTN